ncbi:uncharacterized protein J4E78_005727 [Alternaria triticimaculans]|uniref:uncharacterized protein n=1 Tax=Alternaria triticimaculans TaxID=297637 RepID=UPI0020C4CD73|nr:uncharacterized protein J4E78_005727 [Alternaria triticimaculans]KAI4659300.1 hypothetical protein J4E78_005727 [Alternaria triticimaculans]
MASPSTASQTTNGILILWGSVDSATVDQDALNDWWTNEHLPERVCLPGFQRARRYRAQNPSDGLDNYLALYETSRVQDLASTEYLYALNHPTKRTVQFMPCLAQMSRFACERIWSNPSSISKPDHATSDNGWLVMLVFEVANATDDPISRIDDCLRREEHGALAETTHTQIAKVNADITRVGTTSKSYDDVQFNNSGVDDGTKPADTFIALLEFERSADGPGPIQVPSNKWLASLTTILTAAGLHIQYLNTYTLLASLAKNQIAC